MRFVLIMDMKTYWIWLSGLTLLVLVYLASCDPLAVPTPTTGDRSTRSQATTPSLAAGPAKTQVRLPTADTSTESIQLAEQDLIRRLQVPAGSITVAAVIGQDFSANAFYCWKTQGRIAKDDSPVVISGYSILLSVAGQRYEYHASGQTVIFCRPLS